MSLRKIQIQIDSRLADQRLDQVLATVLPESLGQQISKAAVRKLIIAGAVYLNGQRVRIASKTLFAGARVVVWIDEAKHAATESARRAVFQFDPAWILFEDDWLLAVSKPAGLPTQPTLDEARDNLFALLKRALQQRPGAAPGEAYLGLHHRLDRDTSGVILFTKNREANPGIAEIFAGRLAQKTYLALTLRPRGWNRPVGNEWRVENYLKKERTGHGKQSWMVPTRSGGDFAATRIQVLEDLGRGLSIEAKPETGRMHQIRVHLAEEAIPILGDSLYGRNARWPDGIEVPRVMLHAVNLTFPHPLTKKEVSICGPPPEDFQKCLASLRLPEGKSPGSSG